MPDEKEPELLLERQQEQTAKNLDKGMGLTDRDRKAGSAANAAKVKARRVLGEHRYEVTDPVVSSKPGEQGETDVHHALGLRDHDRAPPEARQPMPLAGIVALDAVCLVLARVALPYRQHVIDSVIVRAGEPCPPALEPLDQALAGGLVTTAALPVHQLA